MHYPRFADSLLNDALEDSPVILIHGPRQCGKTTLARAAGEKRGYHYISFDDDNQLQAARTDPVGFVQSLPEKVILDEVQRVPSLFTSLKAEIDKQRQPGRFVLTGSANVLLLPALADSLAGRMEVIRLRPLARCEMAGQEPDLLQRLFEADLSGAGGDHRRRLGETLPKLICQGGYPSAIARRSEKRRNNWYRDYGHALIQRDIQDLARIRNLGSLPKLLTLSAGQTARLFNASELASPFSLSRPTIREYLTLLEQIFLIEPLEPWHNNRLSRLVKTPKLHLADTGLACALLGIGSHDLWRDKALLGQMLETFVYQELRKQADWHEEELHFYHYRDKDKLEVDIIIEQGRQLAGIEIKAAGTVTQSDFKGLKRLQDASRERFAAGVLFYDGDTILPFGERLFAVPISVLAPDGHAADKG
ncbi:ATP-binding protein [Alcanivorax sp. ZXX171]|nr:ATP-binding protein [Alcanivorax sp. ZXX171]